MSLFHDSSLSSGLMSARVQGPEEHRDKGEEEEQEQANQAID
jgi:hypothetical protein